MARTLALLCALALLAPLDALAQDAAPVEEPPPAPPEAPPEAAPVSAPANDTKESVEPAPQRAIVVVTLVDGRRYEGELVARDGGRLVIETAAGERVVVPESAVARVEEKRPATKGLEPLPTREEDELFVDSMTALGAAGGLIAGAWIGGGIAVNSDTRTGIVAIGLLVPTLTGLGGWGASALAGENVNPIGPVAGAWIGGLSGLGLGVGLLALSTSSQDVGGILLSTGGGLIVGTLIGHQLAQDYATLQSLQLSIAPTQGGATMGIGGRF